MNTALAVAVCYAHCAATSGRNIHFVRKAPDGWSCDGPETQLVQYIHFGHELQNKTKQKNNKENGCSFSGLLQTVCGLKGGSGEAGDCGQEDAMTGREESIQ